MAAVANLRDNNTTIEISATLFLYGSEAATEIGELIIKEINQMYNEPRAKVHRMGMSLEVRFNIRYAIISTEEAFTLASSNRDHSSNFIRIENENTITRSFMGFGLGDNAGHWLTSDQLGVSTTAAHEFGHCLGLDHPANPDFRGTYTPPPIMAARGSLVDPEYQWNPLAKAGEYGGTMKPVYRKVREEEVREILAGIDPFSPETQLIGYLSNNIFDRTGKPYPSLS
ncbi:hypothetical protein DYBT9275_05079 [Dyadobacter sp. CECT 9275]|uniref:Peptidase M10 n=1 Tax=Dyadobacter helix TaxID=2822344 RepID=A0A916JFM4_9BACT|nr:hypothetical protein [Dyadobacter sp. CECT 9275]CAG5012017.1 hypothetical protein DYBT9275_05079 [Dyadobacter sp. CECT 9275]